MSRTAVAIALDAFEQALLEKMTRQLAVPEYQKQRVRAVLAAASGLQNSEIARQIGLNRNDVGKWRTRWSQHHQDWQHSDPAQRPKMDGHLVLHWLSDHKGRGRTCEITPEQRAKIADLSQETPAQYGLSVTHWTLNDLVDVSIKCGIIDKISRVSVHRILKKTTLADTG